MSKRRENQHKFIGHVCWAHISVESVRARFKIGGVELAGKVLFSDFGNPVVSPLNFFEKTCLRQHRAPFRDPIAVIVEVGSDNAGRRDDIFLVQKLQDSVVRLGHPRNTGTHSPNSLVGDKYHRYCSPVAVDLLTVHCGNLGLILSVVRVNGYSNDCSTGQQVRKTDRVRGTARHAVVNNDRNCMSTKDAGSHESTGLQDTTPTCPSCGEEILDIFTDEITGRRASPCGCALTRKASSHVDAQLSGRPADKSIRHNGRVCLMDDGREAETHLESDITCKDIVGVDPR